MQLSIGDFSRMTYLSIKALRHYHELGLLEPADVNPHTGYRSYDSSQVSTAQVIRRFRELGIPVEEVKAVLNAPDLAERNALMVRHLERMESQLDQIQSTVSSLRTLLEPSPTHVAVEYRTVPSLRAASIANTVNLGELERWWIAAFAEIYPVHRGSGRGRRLRADRGAARTVRPGPRHRASPGRTRGRPASGLALRCRPDLRCARDPRGGTRGVEGPIREHYLVTSDDTVDDSQLRTEICWPVFRTVPRD